MIRFFKKILITFWKIWFLFWFFALIIILGPIAALGLISEKTYWIFFFTAKIWAKTLLFLGGFFPKKQGNIPSPKSSQILVSNHASPLDILLIFVLAKRPLVFIGKSSLRKIPLFGFFYKRVAILVDRSDKNSRANAFKEAKKRLEKGLDICIFPEGGIPDDKRIVLDTFKNGAFRLSIALQIPIVPIAFLDCKKKLSYTFFSGAPGVLRSVIHTPIKPESEQGNQQVTYLKKRCHQILHEKLTQ